MKIAGIQKSSVVDYPGLVSIAVFTPYCNYDCFYCHNREILSGDILIDTDQVLDFAQKRSGLIEGFVISGGEPTLQPNLEGFIMQIKELGYKVKLDTNGGNLDAVKKLIEQKLIDYIAVDLKAPFEKYSQICGGKADGKTAKQTIEYILASHIPCEIRTTMIPQLSAEEMLQTIRELPRLPRYAIQQYIKPQYLRECDRFRANVKPHSNDYMEKYAKECEEYCDNVVLKF
ncbi:MAG: anaerobic ribonucleoside-triphosphate reductase activating protein [Eubacteriales bacterium]